MSSWLDYTAMRGALDRGVARVTIDNPPPSSVAAPSPRGTHREVPQLTLSPELLTPAGAASGRDYAQRRIVLEYEA
jgi:hypothetical protein